MIMVTFVVYLSFLGWENVAGFVICERMTSDCIAVVVVNFTGDGLEGGGVNGMNGLH